MRRYFFTALLTLCLTAMGQTDTTTIVDHITAGTAVTIELPEELRLRLVPVEGEKEAEEEEHQPVARPQSGKLAGYRVQVFSDNNPRTAKSEAANKKRAIDSRFPHYQTYVNYTSPYWRLRVGDFRTQKEAAEAADELRRAFPAYSKEIRVVRDRVNISAN